MFENFGSNSLNLGNYSLPTQDYNFDTSWLNSGDAASSAGNILGNMDWGKVINTLGKLGSGIGGFMSAREAGNMPEYIPTTQWLGNGLARTGYISNAANKQNKLDQAAGATNALSSLFGKGYGLFGRGFGDSDYATDYNEQPFLNWLHEKQGQYGAQSI